MTDAQTKKRDKMKAKIAAMLAKAESTEFGPERDAFMAKAESLMLEYAIAEAELVGLGDKSPRDFVVQKHWWKVAEGGSPIQQSLKDLLSAICTNNRVKVAFYRSGKVSEPEFAYMVGTESDIEFVEMLFASLRLQMVSDMEPKVDPNLSDAMNVKRLREGGLSYAAIDEKMGLPANGTAPRLYQQGCEEAGEEPRKIYSVKKIKRNFAHGFVSAVSKRMRDARREREQVQDTTALVPVNNAVADVFSENTSKGRGRKRQDIGYDADARERGFQSGSRADLGGKKFQRGTTALGSGS